MKVLVVDLDGTLTPTDLMYESMVKFVKSYPLKTAQLVKWYFAGKAVFKTALARNVDLAASTLPFDEKLISWLKNQKAQGTKIVMCSASAQKYVDEVAEHLNFFDLAIGTTPERNMRGANKVEELNKIFGKNNYYYVGDAHIDLEVWAASKGAVVVSNDANLIKKAQKITPLVRVFQKKQNEAADIIRLFRPRQWLKNTLLLIPLLATHQFDDFNLMMKLLIAFICLSLCASSVYIFNDLLDLENDRRHSLKKERPIAAGLVSIPLSIALFLLLISGGLIFSYFLNFQFLILLLVYLITSTLYSFSIKSLILVDCITLSLLFILRIAMGNIFVAEVISYWLLVFPFFLFFSLALMKRYVELNCEHFEENANPFGRGYHINVKGAVLSLGLSSGVASVVVLALYLHSDAVLELYQTPAILVLCVPVLLYWISRMWFQAALGVMRDDPLEFAATDRISWLSMVACLGFGVLGFWL